MYSGVGQPGHGRTVERQPGRIHILLPGPVGTDRLQAPGKIIELWTFMPLPEPKLLLQLEHFVQERITICGCEPLERLLVDDRESEIDDEPS